MLCYIATKPARAPGSAHQGLEWYADVVTEQDYHERGAHARSFRAGPHPDAELAREMAREWAEDAGLTLSSVEAVSEISR